MLSARKFLRYSACLPPSPCRASVAAVIVELRPVPLWSRNRTCKQSAHELEPFARPYLISFAEDEVHPGVRLRGTTSKARATLQIDQPRKFPSFALLRWLNRRVFASNAARKESQGVTCGFTVIHGHIKEQLGDPKFAWRGISDILRDETINRPATLWNRRSINLAVMVAVLTKLGGSALDPVDRTTFGRGLRHFLFGLFRFGFIYMVCSDLHCFYLLPNCSSLFFSLHPERLQPGVLCLGQ